VPDYIINGVTHDYSSIEMQLGPMGYEPRITEISYKTSLKSKKVFGTPRKAIGRTGGKEEPEASLTMLKAAWDDLVANLGNGYGLIEFDILINYRKRGSALYVTDSLLICRIEEPDISPSESEDPVSVKVGLSLMRLKLNGKEIVDDEIG
jgi:hypothetical protein